MPSRPGERINTDRRDSRKLARLHAAGLLEAIHCPSPELEALRDLLRAREDARLDRMRAPSAVEVHAAHGRPLPGNSWGVARRRWLSDQRFQFPAQQQTLADYLHAPDLLDRRIEALERSLDDAAAGGPWAVPVDRLRCLRGVDTLTALGTVCEIGDFARFKTAEQSMAFVGLIPSEHSSGESQRRGSITNAGNAHVRRLLVEAAWHGRLRRRSATSSPAVNATRIRS